MLKKLNIKLNILIIATIIFIHYFFTEKMFFRYFMPDVIPYVVLYYLVFIVGSSHIFNRKGFFVKLLMVPYLSAFIPYQIIFLYHCYQNYKWLYNINNVLDHLVISSFAPYMASNAWILSLLLAISGYGMIKPLQIHSGD